MHVQDRETSASLSGFSILLSSAWVQYAVAVVIVLKVPAFPVAVERIVSRIEFDDDAPRRLDMGNQKQVHKQPLHGFCAVVELVMAVLADLAGMRHAIERRLAGKPQRLTRIKAGDACASDLAIQQYDWRNKMMKAHDVMTKDVASIGPDASVQRAAGVMAGRRISGLPVVTRDGEIIGIISESDLLHRVELGTAAAPARLTAYFADPEETARQFAKAHGAKVHEVMSRPVVSVDANTDLAEVADTLDRYGIKRLPVLKDGRLAGMITRSDLVRALTRVQPAAPSAQESAGAIHEAITSSLHRQPWLETSYLNVSVAGGLVRVGGFIRSEEEREALRVLIEQVPGVSEIDDNLTVGLPELGWDGLH